MKIYFAGSIRGGRDDKDVYLEIITMLSQYGTVLTEHIGNSNLSAQGETQLSDQHIYQRDMDWVSQADVVVAEVTTPSLGVGYELGKAEGMDKPLLCLYRPTEGKRLSGMITGNPSFLVREYQDILEIPTILTEFFASLPNTN
jgi:nucleoside 2-deoxyribosyltransferase